MNNSNNKNVFKVIGIGGTGRRIINNIIDNNIEIDSLFIDTDLRDIELSNATEKLYIHTNKELNELTGLELSLLSLDDKKQIVNFSKNCDLVFIVCNSSGNTSTSLVSAIKEILKGENILTLGICIKDFYSTDSNKINNTKKCIKELYDFTNSLIVISNEKALSYFNVDEPNIEVINYVNDVVSSIVAVIDEVANSKGLINVDFNDIKLIIKNSGLSMVSEGISIGDEKPSEAAKKAVTSPLVEISVRNIKSAIIQISSSIDLSMDDVYDIVNEIRNQIGEDVDIIIGTSFCGTDDNMKKIKVNVIASFDEECVENSNLLDYIINN